MARNGRAVVRVQRRRQPAQATDTRAVALVAYQLFQKRGGVHGHDLDDWIKAERIVRSRAQRRSAR